MTFRYFDAMSGRDVFHFFILASVLALGACIAPYNANNPYPFGPPPGVLPSGSSMSTASQTVGLENVDRIARFRRLAGLNGIEPPAIEQIIVQPGQVPGLDHAVPVLRVSFDERILFDFNSDQPRPEAAQVLDLIADSMRRDVPDAQMTLLGHTDAIGTDTYNDDLSLRRARDIFQALVDRGGNAAQLSTVAVGKRQPIAPNSTADGRARNRRVELLISASLDANLAVVKLRPVNLAYLSLDPGLAPVAVPPLKLAVLRPQTYTGPSDVSEAEPNGTVKLQPVGSVTLTTNAPAAAPAPATPTAGPVIKTPAPAPVPQLNTPRPFQIAPLGPPVSY